MLNESLERLSKIGSPQSIAFVARWLSEDVTSVNTLISYANSTAGIKNSEVEPILLLLESMDLIKIIDNSYIDGAAVLKSKYNQGEDRFQDWFIDKFIEFALDNAIIDIDSITYSIDHNAFILSATTIKPRQHACYRNILISYDVITLLSDARYLVNYKLDKAIKMPKRHRHITEKQLLHKLEEQREQGERGEMFVLEYEKTRISNPSLQANIQRISIIDVSAGYDIVSYQSNDSTKIDRYIEVKTFKGKEHFHWSQNEIDKAKLMGESYFIYLVDDDCIDKEDYEPIIIQNPIVALKKSCNWECTPDSYEVERITGIEALVKSAATNSSELENQQTGLSVDLSSSSQQNLVLKELINEAVTMDNQTLNVMETLLGRLNDKHNGQYKDYIKQIRHASDMRNNHSVSATILDHPNIEKLENFGTYYDSSVNIDNGNITK